MFKILIGFLLVLMSITRATSSEYSGTCAAEFLKIQHDARMTALGNTGTGLIGDVDSFFLNPASLIFIRNKELTASYLRYFGESHSGRLGLAYPLKIGTLGIGLSFFTLPDIPYTTVDHRPLKTFSNTDFSIQAGLGQRMPFLKKIRMGASLAFINESFYSASRISLGLNLGFYYRLIKNLGIGLAFNNIGISSEVKEDSDPLPWRTAFGFSYRFFIDDLFLFLFNRKLINSKSEDILFLLDIEKSRDTGLGINSGLEIGILDILFLRTGYQIGTDVGGLTLGGGLQYKFYKLDYAFLPDDQIGNTHRITFNMAWGEELDKTKPFVRTISDPYYSTRTGNPYRIQIQVRDESIIDEWMVIIFSSIWSESDIARSYKDVDAPPDEILWDGKDSNGVLARDGIYNYFIRVTDIHGNQTRSPLKQFEIDSDPPDLNPRLNKTEIFLKSDNNWGDLIIDLGTKEKILQYYRINIYQGTEIKESNPVITLFEERIIPRSIPWNGKTEAGDNIRGGIYTLQITISDMAGNESTRVMSVDYKINR
ncbi:MAG: PorV/PorQ family protein [Spirochaetes bacterium]|nr:PorV/PorQ family protein [Spirochaetota bacterium]